MARRSAFAGVTPPSEGSDTDDAPPADAAVAAGAHGASLAEAIQWMAILDLYVTLDGELRRVSIVRDVTDFSGLGALRMPTANENMAATVAEVGRRFRRIDLDARLAGVLPRRRFAMGDTTFDPDLRKNFSYGTLLLRQALASVSPELGDLTQYEFSSRLAYVLSRGGATG